MNARTFPRRAATLVALAAVTAALGVSTAGAEPKNADQPRTPAELGIEQLLTAAGPNPEAQAAVSGTTKAARLVAAAKLSNIGFAPFGYTAPTIGCGNYMPFTMTAASAIAGGTEAGISGPPGTLRFQATPAFSGMPLSSGLSVAWVNVANGRSGINALDDVTEYNLPSLGKTVESGAGTVVASLWGTIDYPGSRCVVLPTVGLFTIPDLPPVPAVTDPAAPAAPAAPPAAPGAEAPATTPAEAPDSGSGATGSGNAGPSDPN
ncbi:hypothetical protein [Nocardia jejuensis]|uniref:hypothetical protein n=1 Tax=Nocardia jejuensis TaxID=328049 RepID=UPI00082FD96D|nr:hypothetical protein [Nocardia jejuensis]